MRRRGSKQVAMGDARQVLKRGPGVERLMGLCLPWTLTLEGTDQALAACECAS